eukprot:3898706-Pleurochrysis_carterae.AAC.1
MAKGRVVSSFTGYSPESELLMRQPCLEMLKGFAQGSKEHFLCRQFHLLILGRCPDADTEEEKDLRMAQEKRTLSREEEWEE